MNSVPSGSSPIETIVILSLILLTGILDFYVGRFAI